MFVENPRGRTGDASSRCTDRHRIFCVMSDTDPITRLNAALEGRYRIESELGEGGMAGRRPG